MVTITGAEYMWISIASIGGVVAIICTTIISLRDRAAFLQGLLHNGFLILQILTVFFVIWATTALSIFGSMNEAAAGIFGAIVGMFFGSMRIGGNK